MLIVILRVDIRQRSPYFMRSAVIGHRGQVGVEREVHSLVPDHSLSFYDFIENS